MVQEIFLASCRPRTKPCVRGRQTKKGRRGKCERLGCYGMENSSWESRENRGPGGKEGDTGADTTIDEGEEEENDGEREKNRRAEERNREE